MACKFTADDLSETFKRCKVDPKPGHEYTIEEVADIILKTTRISYPSCKDIFTEELTMPEIVESLGFISVVTGHPTFRFHSGGASEIFVCESSPKAQPK